MSDPSPFPTARRRRGDRGWFGELVLAGSTFWDWVDKRQIDVHVLSTSVLYGTILITHWAMTFATSSPRPGLEVAAIIASVSAPYMALQAAAISFVFKARQ